MALVAFTKTIAANGTPEKLVPAGPPGQPIRASRIFVQGIGAAGVVPTGRLFVGNLETMNPPTSQVGVILTIHIADERGHSIWAPQGMNPIPVDDLWLDATVNGEGVTGYYVTV